MRLTNWRATADRRSCFSQVLQQRKSAAYDAAFTGARLSGADVSTWSDVASQIHRIVQQPKHVDAGWLGRACNPIQHEVPASSPTTRHMKCHEALRDVVALARAGDVRSVGEGLDGVRQGLTVDTPLGMPEPLSSPTENVPKIALSRGGQPNASGGHWSLPGIGIRRRVGKHLLR